MATKKIHLTGCERFNYQNKMYLKTDQKQAHPIYRLEEALADYLLSVFDQSTGYNFFEDYVGDEEGETPGGLDEDREKLVARGPKPKDDHGPKRRTERPQRVSRQTQIKAGIVPQDQSGVVEV